MDGWMDGLLRRREYYIAPSSGRNAAFMATMYGLLLLIMPIRVSPPQISHLFLFIFEIFLHSSSRLWGGLVWVALA